jgi:hypothetical protein
MSRYGKVPTRVLPAGQLPRAAIRVMSPFTVPEARPGLPPLATMYAYGDPLGHL